jgi:hypothetical protein
MRHNAANSEALCCGASVLLFCAVFLISQTYIKFVTRPLVSQALPGYIGFHYEHFRAHYVRK